VSEEIEKEENIIKKVCREYNLTYKKLAEELGYSEGSIRNLSYKKNEEITLNVKRSIEFFIENKKLKNTLNELALLKKTLLKLLSVHSDEII
jgi:hypothetical protein